MTEHAMHQVDHPSNHAPGAETPSPPGSAALAGPTAGGPRWLVGLLAAVCAVALFAAGVAVAVLAGIGRPGVPAEDSVDVGFARDMQVHHVQATAMAGWVRDHSRDPLVRNLAYDIETQQFGEIGRFNGWLDSWGYLPGSDRAPMAWMAGSGRHAHVSADGLMPGMATSAELATLKTLSGTALDVDFLRLMIRHHQGGLAMAQYAAEHAGEDYVRTTAQKIATAQQGEVVIMEQDLRERGGTPLPPPD
ncbi:MAG TPA: DUF305 domain-containing protein [Mycobacteriales bacterium]|nr:DUF305 domain-containing protein [Mycobacteriales bacterium]